LDKGSINNVALDGVFITILNQIHDQRGSVLHMMRCDDERFLKFGECYFSEVYPGAIKAWKRHKVQTQNLAVIVGNARFVIFDDRQSSNTMNCIQVVEMGRPDSYVRLTIPPNLWYGFSCIGSDSAIIANCPDYPHDPAESQKLSADTDLIPYNW